MNTNDEAKSAAASDIASLEQATKKRDRLLQKLEKVARADREQCEFSAGDCLVLVGERRERLAREYGLSCGARTEPARRSVCVVDGLSSLGKQGDAKAFYSFENWCVERVLACTDDRSEKAAVAVLDQRRAARKHEVVTSSQGIAAWNAVELARARVQYLESTLPPNAGESCSAAAESCSERVTTADTAFQAELGREDYDLGRTTQAYEAAREIEASCETPAFDCLKQALAPFGMYPQSENWLQKNLALLEMRQGLTRDVTPEAQADCLATPSADHQDAIVAAFTAYVNDPVLYFRTQLEKAFFAMHQAQVACLASQPKLAGVDGERSAARSE